MKTAFGIDWLNFCENDDLDVDVFVNALNVHFGSVRFATNNFRVGGIVCAA